MVVRDLEDLETYQDQDNRDSELYKKDSFTAEEYGFLYVLTTFILIVILVCIVGLTITSPCCCRGQRANLVSMRYQKSSYVLEMPEQHSQRNPSNHGPSTTIDLNP